MPNIGLVEPCSQAFCIHISAAIRKYITAYVTYFVVHGTLRHTVITADNLCAYVCMGLDCPLLDSCSVTRYCNEDCVLGGVQFRKGALVVLVIDSIHQNPTVWRDPEVFSPDRLV